MARPTCEQNSPDEKSVDGYGTALQLNTDGEEPLPRDLHGMRLGLLLMVAAAVAFYGSIGAFIVRFI